MLSRISTMVVFWSETSMPTTVPSATTALTQAAVGTVDPVKDRGQAREAESREELIAFADVVAVGGIVSLRTIVHHSTTPSTMDRGTQTIRALRLSIQEVVMETYTLRTIGVVLAIIRKHCQAHRT
jgi:hypothetical protein